MFTIALWLGCGDCDDVAVVVAAAVVVVPVLAVAIAVLVAVFGMQEQHFQQLADCPIFRREDGTP